LNRLNGSLFVGAVRGYVPLTGSVRGPSIWSEARRLIPRALGEAINATSFFRPSSGLGYPQIGKVVVTL
jgi:hypothetical protein